MVSVAALFGIIHRPKYSKSASVDFLYDRTGALEDSESY